MISSKNWGCWINAFFDDLEVYEDKSGQTSHKQVLLDTVTTFMETPSEVNAEKVYSSFFTAYWIGDKDNNPFLELVNKVKRYEQIAGSLIRKQRDHYAHAVYVFVFGLVVYQKTPKFQNAFYDVFLPHTNYKDSYSTKNEEFLYRWGLCSLFHDIAYPLEITINQLNEYFNHSLAFGNEQWQEKFLDITGFNDYKTCICFDLKEEYKKEFCEKYGDSIPLKQTSSCEILADDLAKDLCVDKEKASVSIMNYDNLVSKGIVDHAYFGALICLRWHSLLIKTKEWNPAYFFFPVLDAAAAIFLHNGYKHLFQKKDYNLGPLNVVCKPIAFLLILADNIQEWKRPNYGVIASDKDRIHDVEIDFFENGDGLEICYIVEEEFDKEKITAIGRGLASILDVDGLFPKGIVFNQRKE